MSLQKVTLPELEKGEIAAFRLNLAKWTMFADSLETLASVVFEIYLASEADDSYTPIPTMLYDAGSVTSNSMVQCNVTTDVAAAVKDTSYVIKAVMTCSSGHKYIAKGKFKVVVR